MIASVAMVDPSALPDPGSARSALEMARANGVTDPRELDTLATVAGTSLVLGRYLGRKPASLARLALAAGHPRSAEAHVAEARALRAAAGSGLAASIRDYRNIETARVLMADLAGAPVRDVAREIADIASACFAVAIDDAIVSPPLDDEKKQPIPFTVFGMGKLGGRELNYSSDVDVIYVYGTDRGVAADGKSPHEWFAAAASRITRALAEVTEDGVAFRVDLDLRPEGKRGPPVNALRSLEVYYESYGATWERAAWLRARAIAGDPALGATVLSSMEPFMYRRWLDYATIDAIREMKERIDREARAKSAKGAPFDVKLGKGGIRELEFFVQTLQLVNAGKRPEVRATHTLDALDRLTAAGLVKEPERVRLATSWEFLRRLEHRLQARELAQTHSVPEDDGERAVIAATMGLGHDTRRLATEIETHTGVVAEAFDGLFRDKTRKAKEASGPETALLSDPDLTPDAGRALAAQLGLFANPDAAADAFARIRSGPARSRHKEAAFRYLARIAPPLFEELSVSPDADAAVHNLEGFLSKIGGRTTLLALLAEHSPTVTLLVRLFGASDHLAATFIARPELLDVLFGSGHTRPVRRRPELRAEARAMVAAGTDHEARLDAIRRFRISELLRVGMADLWGGLELASVQRQLSDVADAVAEQSLAVAAGDDGPTKAPPPGFVVLGFGRLGGREMAYSSDIDLVFLHDGDVPGAPPVDSLPKLAQRFLAALSAPTREGVAYRVDTRLRPSGSSGPLVVTIAALLRYHRESARVWERQAWLRARPIAGDRHVWRRVQRTLSGILLRAEPGPAALAGEISSMREKMQRELSGKRLNVKTGHGGLVDAEFAAQLLQLVHGRTDRSLLSPSTSAALRRAAKAGRLDRKAHDALASGYRFLTHLENRLRVVTGRPEDDIADDDASWSALARRCRLAGGDGARLRAEYLAITASVRAAFDGVVDSVRATPA